MSVPDKFLKPYEPQSVEDKLYEMWQQSGYFNPDRCIEDGICNDDAEPFSIIMPPPNANGSLHAGHALFVTIQDIMTRYARMQGKRTLWYPGADHAGFETQVVYEKKLTKEGRSRFQMSREELYNEILNFTQENKSFMEGQIRQLGASCDWSRELFTLDDRVIKTVYDTFAQLDKDGLLYRGLRSINWCPKHQTGLSNLEVTYQERKEPFYYIKYGPFTIGTSRPETKFGDKYVVMHPDDKRYAEYKHGQEIEVDWLNGKIVATIIKDEAGDPEMGSGVMTITPWHSAIDWEIAQRHNLDYEQIIDDRGKLLDIAGEFAGMNIKEARPKIVEKLDKLGLLVKVDEDYEHSVPVCYKCSREIEPQLKQQWFIKMRTLADNAIEAINNGEIKIITDEQKKVALHWLNNIEDWNISRQVVWGIPIPAKLCNDCGHGEVDINNSMNKCTKCGGIMEQDTDTFDTWFSSGQWPYATLGYPDSDDYKTYYPTSIMETGRDLVFFWVSRMIMLGLYRTGKVPFKTVFFHGMVNDAKGKKMSKSKGNVINPLEISTQYGTDALRMGLIVGNAPGTDLNLDTQKINAYRKFSNKLWNITRFILTELDDVDISLARATNDTDKELLQDLESLVQTVSTELDTHMYHLASDRIYHYVWHELADKILEESKPILQGDNTESKLSRQYTLYTILTTSLKLLHPFMPFITEEIWQSLPHTDTNMLMVAPWPMVK
jgi:valyl-tRNA synthetase